MEPDRVYFKGNPWPEGHPLDAFGWKAKVVDGDVWFDFHIETVDYNAERDIEEDWDVEHDSDWASPEVWKNYRRCILSSWEWHEGGFKVCSAEDYSPEFLDGLEIAVDAKPAGHEDDKDFAFLIYVFEHGPVGNNRFTFKRIPGTDLFDITWTGQLAKHRAGKFKFGNELSMLLIECEFPEADPEDEDE